MSLGTPYHSGRYKVIVINVVKVIVVNAYGKQPLGECQRVLKITVMAQYESLPPARTAPYDQHGSRVMTQSTNRLKSS